MKYKASNLRRMIDPAIIANGTYPGTVGGYEVQFTVNGVAVIGQMDKGIRGINIPCTVHVHEGEVTVSVNKW